MSLGVLLRAVHYDSVGCFAFDQMRGACADRHAFLRVPWALVSQWFRYGIFGVVRNMDVDLVLALLALARVAEADQDARPNLNWLLYTFEEGLVSVLFASAPLRWVSTFGEHIKEGNVPMRRPIYQESFESHWLSEAYARKKLKQFTDTGMNLADSFTVDERDALMSEEEEVVVVEPLIETIAIVDNDALLGVNENDN